MTQRLKLLLLIVMSSATFVAAAYTVSKQVIDEIVADLLWKYAQVSARYDAETLLRPIIQEVELIKQLSTHPNITSWGFHSDDDVYRSVAEDTLEHYRWQLKSKNFFIALDQNLAYHFNDVKTVRSETFFRHYLDPAAVYDTWYFEQKESLSDLSVNIATDAHLSLTRVWINQSITKNGQFLGILGTGIEVSTLFQQLTNHHSSALRTIFVDARRRIQLSFDGGEVGYPLRDSTNLKPRLSEVITDEQEYQALETLMKRQKMGQESEVLMVQQGVGRAVVAIHYIEELGWYELTFVSIDEMVPSWLSTYLYFPLVLLTGLFALLAYVYLVKHWIAPTEYREQRLAFLARVQPSRQEYQSNPFDKYLDKLEEELRQNRIGVDSMVASRTEALDKLTVFDVVTQLYNKRGLERELRLELSRANREHYQFGLIWIDAGISKAIKTDSTSEAYSLSLQMVADALQQAIREYDIAARWADDEFLLLIRSGQCETLQQVATRIQEYVDEHPMIPGTDTRYVGDLAIGGTLINPDMSMQQALALTDSSLYIAKSQQEEAIYIHTHALEKKSA